MMSAILGLLAATLFVLYGALLWKRILKQRDTNSDLLYRVCIFILF